MGSAQTESEIMKNPNRPKIKYKHVKKPPPPRLTPEEKAARQLERTEARLDITPEKVNVMIAQERGLLTQVCRSLKVPRATLLRYIEKHAECQEAMTHARDAMGDKAEKKLFQLIDAGDVRCLLFYLSTVQGHRGYRMGNLNGTHDPETGGRPVFVETVNIVGIPRGTFLPKELATADNMVIEN